VIGWPALLQKFRDVQDRATRTKSPQSAIDEQSSGLRLAIGSSLTSDHVINELPRLALPGQTAPVRSVASDPAIVPSRNDPKHKGRSGLGNLGRLARGVGGQKSKK
jgi:hypothetical protein